MQTPLGWKPFTALSTPDVAERLETDLARGLGAADAAARLARYGRNELPDARTSWHAILFRQFRSSFVYILGGAAAIAFALGEIPDGALILLFIFANAALGFYQEYRSEAAARLLASYIARKATVIRDGVRTDVNAGELVPGDLVAMRAGDAMPADVRIIECDGLSVDESSLTGESLPASKDASALLAEAAAPYEARNVGFSGTLVVAGSALAVVVATGGSTVIGETARLATATKRASALEKGLNRFSVFILRLSLGTLAVVFVAHLIFSRGEIGIGQLALFAIALGVSVIPEGLPVVTTFSLSRGAVRLARSHVVVKRLSSIEDLGSIDILCTDKTGTITENRMSLQDSMLRGGADLVDTATLAGAWPDDAGENRGSFDVPLWEYLGERGAAIREGVSKLHAIPFDPVRRFDSALLRNADGSKAIVMRGAPENILDASGADQALRDEVAGWMAAQGTKGRRVIAFAMKAWTADLYGIADEAAGFAFSGALAFADPMKASTPEAIAQARALGVGIKVLTGDSLEVAQAIGREAGLIRSDDEAMSGAQFDALDVDGQHEAVARVAIFARVSPEQKHRIVRLLQEKHSVGYLGDGINDAPALKAADVGLAVQGATDIARESADIILLERSLLTIVGGIREGRGIFVNTMKYLKATLSANFGNFYAVALGSLVIKTLPMLPVQLLLLNLLTDSPMIAVAMDRVDDGELKKPKAYKVREIALLATVLGIVSTTADFVYFGLFMDLPPAQLQTNWFVGSVLTELLFLFSVRSRLPMWRASRPAFSIVAITGVAAAIGIALPFTWVGQEIFGFAPPTLHTLLLVVGIALIYLVATEVAKNVYYRTFKGIED